MSSSLFSIFPSSSGEWERLVEAELKKPGAAQTLAWHTDEGFQVEPYHKNYLNDEVSQLAKNISELLTKTEGSEFYNYQMFSSSDSKELNKKVRNALNNGVNGLLIKGDHNASELDLVLDQVLTEYIWVDLVSTNPASTASNFSEVLKKRGVDSKKQLGAICMSPLQNLAESGSWKNGQEKDLTELKSYLLQLQTDLPTVNGICVNAGLVANAGGNITQQIAFALSQGNEYLNWALENGLDPAVVSGQINFHFSYGTNFLLECVKIRSFKWLWSIILKEYGVNEMNSFVSSCTSTIGSAVYDSHNNLLRYTTASMSAIISGSDAHTVLPYDSIYSESSDFSDRIARNITNLLLEESFLGKVENVTNGSFAFDNLQYLLCQHSWEMFQKFEAEGGFIKSLDSGSIQKEIQVSAENLKTKFSANQLVVLGVNKYPNKLEKKSAEWKGNNSTAAANAKAIVPFRLAESSENERLIQEA